MDSLSRAAAAGDVAALRRHPESAMSSRGSFGETLLHVAAGNGRLEVCDFLLSTAPGPSLLLLRDMNQKTALHYGIPLFRHCSCS